MPNGFELNLFGWRVVVLVLFDRSCRCALRAPYVLII
jgi:hypothetical protein